MATVEYTAEDWYVHQDMLDSALYWLMTAQQRSALGEQGIANLQLSICSAMPTTYTEAYETYMLMRGFVTIGGTQAIEGSPGGRWILLRLSIVEGVPLFTIQRTGSAKYAALTGVYQGENTLLFACPATGEVVEGVPMVVRDWCISITYPYTACEVPT